MSDFKYEWLARQWTVPGTALEAEERRQRNLMGEIADAAREREIARLRKAAMQRDHIEGQHETIARDA